MFRLIFIWQTSWRNLTPMWPASLWEYAKQLLVCPSSIRLWQEQRARQSSLWFFKSLMPLSPCRNVNGQLLYLIFFFSPSLQWHGHTGEQTSEPNEKWQGKTGQFGTNNALPHKNSSWIYAFASWSKVEVFFLHSALISRTTGKWSPCSSAAMTSVTSALTPWAPFTCCRSSALASCSLWPSNIIQKHQTKLSSKSPSSFLHLC